MCAHQTATQPTLRNLLTKWELENRYGHPHRKGMVKLDSPSWWLLQTRRLEDYGCCLNVPVSVMETAGRSGVLASAYMANREENESPEEL